MLIRNTSRKSLARSYTWAGVCGYGLLTIGACTPIEPDPTPVFQLQVLVYGEGQVLLTPSGGSYEAGTEVALVGVENRHAFTLWGRDATGTQNTTRVVVDRDMLVVALFEGASLPSNTYDFAVIEAADGQFLGVIDRQMFLLASVANPTGPFGDNSSETCVWNPVSEYGSCAGNISAYASNAVTPPIIVSDTEFVAFLTTNPQFSPSFNPNELATSVGREDEVRDCN